MIQAHPADAFIERYHDFLHSSRQVANHYMAGKMA
jgi:hypothetical protein